MRRLSIIALLVLFAGSIAAAVDDTAAVQRAYVTYVQARLDRNLPAAQSASTGDEIARRYLEKDMERQELMDRLEEAQRRMSSHGAAPTSRPVLNAADLSRGLLAHATLEINGDDAKLNRQGSPVSLGFKRIDGIWKADLNRWDPPLSPKRVEEMERIIPIARSILVRIDSGEIKSNDQLEKAMMEGERSAGGRASSRPSTRP